MLAGRGAAGVGKGSNSVLGQTCGKERGELVSVGGEHPGEMVMSLIGVPIWKRVGDAIMKGKIGGG